MRFSAISSCVKSWVSNSTFVGSLLRVAGRVGTVVVEGSRAGGVLQRNTLPTDCQKDAAEVGMEAGRRDLARPLSTAALTW